MAAKGFKNCFLSLLVKLKALWSFSSTPLSSFLPLIRMDFFVLYDYLIDTVKNVNKER